MYQPYKKLLSSQKAQIDERRTNTRLIDSTAFSEIGSPVRDLVLCPGGGGDGQKGDIDI
jgi:hypothetical protein